MACILDFYCHSEGKISLILLGGITMVLFQPTCSKRNRSIDSMELKFISRETTRHFRMRFGTRASCSRFGSDRSSLCCHRILPAKLTKHGLIHTLCVLLVCSRKYYKWGYKTNYHHQQENIFDLSLNLIIDGLK